uniref:F-box domain-containing protein n=1 Tax=Capra hircus TaxID=9925 RepID=A0A452FKD6_CAPHI
MHRKHLQEVPDQRSNVITSFTWGWNSTKTSELLSGMGVSTLEKEEVDSENIPQELLSNLGHPQSPPRKWLKSKGDDKDFVIVCKPKELSRCFLGFFPDKLLLGIFSCLCLPELLKVSSVCKRWYHPAFVESLWQTVDITGRNLYPDVVGQLLSRGVVAFHCHLFEHFSPFRLQYLDLSNSVILSHCSKLQNLSLEGLQLSDPIVDNLAQKTNLLQLYLSGCSGFSESALKTLLSSCSRLDELNLSWCIDFTEKNVQVAVTHVCPNLIHLDLSDSVMLKNDCFLEFYQLNHLQHLSLRRCYDRIPETLLELGEIPTLKTLQVFGIVPDGILQLLKEASSHLQINCSHFTTITRLTIGNKNQEIWGIKCRLLLEKPSCL